MQNIIEFIKTNLFNKNGRFEGQRLNRRWFEIRNLEKQFEKYKHILLDDEKMFHILRDNNLLLQKFIKSQKYNKCIICESTTEFTSITGGYKLHCSEKCANISRNNTKKSKTPDEKNETNLKSKNTRKERYGDETYNNREKAYKTMEEKYGARTTLQSPTLTKRVYETKLQRYDDPYFNNLQKTKSTCLEKYGYSCVFQSPQIKEKIYNTNILTYGVPYATQSEEVLNKIKEKNLSKYGVEWSFQSENNKSKSKATWLQKYGCHVSCAEEIKEKIKNSKSILDDNGLNSWNRARIKNEQNNRWLPLSEWSEFRKYSTAVWKETKKFIKELENFDKRGRNQDEYHCDHKYSIYQGFKDNVPIEVIGNIVNLEMINSRVNMSKNIKCSINLEDLYELYNKNI